MRTTIVIELIDNKQLNVTGPLEHDRELCVKMIKEALRVAETYKSGMLVLPNPSKMVDLDQNKVNHMIAKKL